MSVHPTAQATSQRVPATLASSETDWTVSIVDHAPPWGATLLFAVLALHPTLQSARVTLGHLATDYNVSHVKRACKTRRLQRRVTEENPVMCRSASAVQDTLGLQGRTAFHAHWAPGEVGESLASHAGQEPILLLIHCPRFGRALNVQ